MSSSNRKLNAENTQALRDLRNEITAMKGKLENQSTKLENQEEEIKKLKKMKARFESLEARIFARQAAGGTLNTRYY
jgi:TolA-binding protein